MRRRLSPSIGIHHCSSANTHRLSDDIMEPFRCFVDLCVMEMSACSDISLNNENKRNLNMEAKKIYSVGTLRYKLPQLLTVSVVMLFS